MQIYLNTVRDTYLTFGGRAGRREYWTFTLVHTLVTLTLWVLVVGSFLARPPPASAQDDAPTFMFFLLLLLAIIYSIGLFLPTFAVTVRRLHDGGDSGWAMLVWVLPLIGGLILLWLLIRKSQPGSNKWGPNPKGVSEIEPAF
ncbi:DUF805 domain-containing protein [Deinococcus sp. UYEF24]